MAPGEVVHVVGPVRLQNVGFEQCVVGDAGERQSVVGQHVLVVLEVLPQFLSFRIGEPRREPREHAVLRKLFRRPGIPMRERQVARVAGLDRQRHADDPCRHRVEARCLRVEADEIGALDRCHPALERRRIEHGLVVAGHRRRRTRARFAFAGSGVVEGPRVLARRAVGDCPTGICLPGGVIDVAKPALEFETLVECLQLVSRGFAGREVRRLDRERTIGLHREEFPAHRQPIARRAQILADHAGDLVRVGDDGVERVVLPEPLRRRLGTDLRHARDVVDGIARQRKQVQYLIGADAEFRDHAGFVERFVAHRVDEPDAGAHQLRQILVRRRHHAIDALRRGLRRERRDDVVGLDAVDHQQRPAVGAHQLVQRLDLPDEVFGHRRPVRLVFGVPVVAKRLARRVEHDGEVVGLLVFGYPPQHRHDTAQRARGFASRRPQVRQRVKRAIEVRRSIDQNEPRHV